MQFLLQTARTLRLLLIIAYLKLVSGNPTATLVATSVGSEHNGSEKFAKKAAAAGTAIVFVQVASNKNKRRFCHM
jgi:hypothetical protein